MGIKIVYFRIRPVYYSSRDLCYTSGFYVIISKQLILNS